MHDLIKEIGDFIFAEDEPQKCNVIITVGGSFTETDINQYKKRK